MSACFRWLAATMALGAFAACVSTPSASTTPTARTLVDTPSATAGTLVRATPVTTIDETTGQKTFDDPIAYCAAAGTVDFPTRDARWAGAAQPLQITEIIKAQPPGTYARPSFPPDYRGFTAWRCVGGVVYYCASGAKGPESCDYALLSQVPTPAMDAYCAEKPEAVYIPDYVVGLPMRSVYWWECRQGLPQIHEQLRDVDAQGFLAGAWHRLP